MEQTGQLGNGDNQNSSVPTRIDGISSVIKVDAYKNTSIVLTSSGQVYVWGEGYSVLPVRQILSERVVDIDGHLLLTESGYVYNLSDINTKIAGLNNIARIASGATHYLALDTDGVVFTWGTNAKGECGKPVSANKAVSEVWTDIYDISAGNQTSILKDEAGKLYVFGNNASRRNRIKYYSI
ncbi:MAG: hypothetical protein K2H53_05480 [Clostridia bacterium]|nr:hypothetical protein [Clostridia bacterium]